MKSTRITINNLEELEEMQKVSTTYTIVVVQNDRVFSVRDNMVIALTGEALSAVFCLFISALYFASHDIDVVSIEFNIDLPELKEGIYDELRL